MSNALSEQKLKLKKNDIVRVDGLTGELARHNGRKGHVDRVGRDGRVAVVGFEGEADRNLGAWVLTEHVAFVEHGSPLWFLDMPKIDGEVAVSFKCESFDRGTPVGPVYVTDVAVSAASGVTAVPFGQPFPGTTELGWHKRSVAQAVAKHYGVALSES